MTSIAEGAAARIRHALLFWLALSSFALLQAGALKAGLPQARSTLYVLAIAAATGASAAMPLLWLALRAAPGSRVGWPRFLATQLAGYASYAFVSILIARTLARALATAFELEVTLRPLVQDLAFETQNTLPLYVALAAGTSAYRDWTRRHEAELHAARLDQQIAHSKLEALRARLDPHAVFEALDRAYDALPHDPARAEMTIHKLAQTMRANLTTSPADVQPANAAVPIAPSPPAELRMPSFSLRAALRSLAMIMSLVMGIGAAVAYALPHLRSVVYIGSFGRALAIWLAIAVVPVVVLNATSPRAVGRLRFVGLHALGLIAFSGIWVGVARACRNVLADWLSVPMPAPTLIDELLIESQRISLVYLGGAALWTAREAFSARRIEDARVAKLQARLDESRLDAVAARLDPHFLFNALNTLTAFSHEDAPRARHLIVRLKDLLSESIIQSAPLWSLGCERRYLERFTDFITARFGDRIALTWQISDHLSDQTVPRFSLQTLVENAVKHNQSQRGRITIRLESTRDGDALRLAVEDDGRGFAARDRTLTQLQAAVRSGDGGLGRLREILRLLHGPNAELTVGHAIGGRGARVELVLPITESP